MCCSYTASEHFTIFSLDANAQQNKSITTSSSVSRGLLCIVSIGTASLTHSSRWLSTSSHHQTHTPSLTLLQFPHYSHLTFRICLPFLIHHSNYYSYQGKMHWKLSSCIQMNQILFCQYHFLTSLSSVT